ncbi:calcium/proton exchanger [Agrocybe pediades]|nr:calcium/proton exchanger [Agrocybe pediades]
MSTFSDAKTSASLATSQPPEMASGHLERRRTIVRKAPTTLQSVKAILRASWLNILLVFIPVSWALHFALPHTLGNRDTVIFVTSFLAIIPLANLLSFATEEISLRVGQTLAGLINATLGNAVELIVAIIALTKCELRVVQASLVGSILSNLLLVLGMCFLAGGLKYSEQGFGSSASQMNSSLLVISVIGLLLPAAFHFTGGSELSKDGEGRAILSVSHGVAIILLCIYCAYILFQLYSHPSLYDDKNSNKTTHYAAPKFYIPELGVMRRSSRSKSKSPNIDLELTVNDGGIHLNAGAAGPSKVEQDFTLADDATSAGEDDQEEPSLNLVMTLALLVVVTVLVAFTAEFLVGSIDGMTEGGHIGKEFVGIILLPIVGNAAEHVTAVTVSVKDKLNLSIGVAVGSSIQIHLFVIPFIVIIAWIMGKPLTLLFDPYESVSLFLAVLTVNSVVLDGRSNWMEGFILMCLYLILGLTFWFYPGSDPSGVLASCH